MSSDSAQKAGIAGAIRRAVAIATLKRIHRHIEDDRLDDIRGKRFAGITIGVFLTLFFGWTLTIMVRMHVRPGSVWSGGDAIAALCALTFASTLFVAPLVLTWYFARVYPGAMRRYVAIAAGASVLLGTLLTGLSAVVRPIEQCDGASQSASYEHAVREYPTCLSYPNVPTSIRERFTRERDALRAKLGEAAAPSMK